MNTSADHLLRENFLNALSDYLFLLEKGYPQKLILKMTGDKYALSGIQRIMLYRGVTLRENNADRQRKRASEAMLTSQTIHIDALNTLITIGTYLTGQTVFMSTDCVLRDASGMHGKTIRTEILHRALSLSLTYLVSQQPKEIIYYVDEQVSDSVRLNEAILNHLSHSDLRGSSVLCSQVDAILSNTVSGIVATSDSTIIDRSRVPFFDLPFHILQNMFQPDFIDLRRFLP